MLPDFGVLEYSYESEYRKYESNKLVDPEIWRIRAEHISRTTEELEEEETDTKESKPDISDKSIRNGKCFTDLFYHKGSSETDEHIDDRKGESRTSYRDYTVLVCVEKREKRVKVHTIYLSTKQCSEVSDQTSIKEGPNKDVDVLTDLAALSIYHPREYREEAKESTSQRERVVICDKKSSQKIKESTSFDQVNEEILLIAPISQDIKYPTPEKYRERIEGNIAPEIFAYTMLCCISVEQREEYSPCCHERETE